MLAGQVTSIKHAQLCVHHEWLQHMAWQKNSATHNTARHTHMQACITPNPFWVLSMQENG
jgi:hypothetical protein